MYTEHVESVRAFTGYIETDGRTVKPSIVGRDRKDAMRAIINKWPIVKVYARSDIRHLDAGAVRPLEEQLKRYDSEGVVIARASGHLEVLYGKVARVNKMLAIGPAGVIGEPSDALPTELAISMLERYPLLLTLDPPAAKPKASK
jgi:hypothetical protein